MTAEKTVTASVCILGKSRTSRPRNHNTSFNLVIGKIEVKISTGKSHRAQSRALYWQHLYNCDACLSSLVRKCVFKDHIKKCVGDHVSNMNFSTIPHVEHFEEREYPNTLLCPIVASFDTEACHNADITRRVDYTQKREDNNSFRPTSTVNALFNALGVYLIFTILGALIREGR